MQEEELGPWSPQTRGFWSLGCLKSGAVAIPLGKWFL